MRMKLGLAASAIALTVATLAYAQGNVIEERQNLMKANGAAMGVVVPMARGEAAFDAAAAQQAFATIADDMTAFPALFPEGSEGGKAAATIWTDREGFEAQAAALAADAAAAAESVSTLEQLQAALGTVGAHGGACHQTYRN